MCIRDRYKENPAIIHALEAPHGDVEAKPPLAFIVLAVSHILQAYNMRSDHSLFTIGVFTNRKLNVAALLSLALICLLYTSRMEEASAVLAVAQSLSGTGVPLPGRMMNHEE